MLNRCRNDEFFQLIKNIILISFRDFMYKKIYNYNIKIEQNSITGVAIYHLFKATRK